MAEAAPNYQQHKDYWKPLPTPKLQSLAITDAAKVRCPGCRTSLPSEAHFCHTCGLDQTAEPSILNLVSVAARLGQSLGSLIALVLGCACLVAAVATGFLFKVATLADWQAIQFWRIEWLLGAIALFAAGLVMKRRGDHPKQ
jgi:hypothetical protein